MLQRIQTVWMALATLAAAFLYVCSRDAEFLGGFPIIGAGCVAAVILGALAIFSFKNRKRQIMLNNTGIIINALLLGLLAYWLLNLPGGMQFPEKGIEPLFPLLAMGCLMIANRYIRRDERLVKSVDRLR